MNATKDTKGAVKRSGRVNIELILTVVAAVVLATVTVYVIYLGFAYYWDELHSDIAVDLAFVREAAYQGTLFPEGWPHLRELRFIHLTTIILWVYQLTGDINRSYPIAVAITLLLNVYLFYYMLSYRKRHVLPIIIGFTVLLMLFSRYDNHSVFSFTIFSLLFTNGSLALSLATIFLTIGAYMRIKSGVAKGKFATIALWTISPLVALVQGIQSNRMLIGLYLPMLVVECYPLLISAVQDKDFHFKKIEKSTLFTGICFLCTLAGVALTLILMRTDVIMSARPGTTSELSVVMHTQVWDRMQSFVPELLLALGLPGGINIFSLAGMLYVGRVLAIIAFATLFLKTSIKHDSDSPIVKIAFASICALSIAMVGMQVSIYERYIFTIVLLFGVIATMVVENFMQNKRRILSCIACGFIFLVVTLSVNQLGFEPRESLVNDRQNVADFILAQGFTVGYGSFVHGPVIAAVGDFEFDVIPVNIPSLSPFLHGITTDVFEHDEENTFLIIPNWNVSRILENNQGAAILAQGERHDFSGGWVVWTFDHNPFR